jgi:hypothetical protein
MKIPVEASGLSHRFCSLRNPGSFGQVMVS